MLYFNLIFYIIYAVQKGNMLVLSKSKPTIMPGKTVPLAVPLPFNTPSLTKESKGSTTTNSITLIPGGSNVMVWGQTPGTSSSTSISVSNHSASGAANTDSSKAMGASGGDDNKPVSTLSSTSSIAPWVKGNAKDASSSNVAASSTVTASSYRHPSKNWADDESDEEDAHDRRQRFPTTTSTSAAGGSSGSGLQGLLGFNQLPDRPGADSRSMDRSFGSDGRGERDRPMGSGGSGYDRGGDNRAAGDRGGGYQQRDNSYSNFNRENRDRDTGRPDREMGFNRFNRGGGMEGDREGHPETSAPPEPSWVSVQCHSLTHSVTCQSLYVCIYVHMHVYV